MNCFKLLLGLVLVMQAECSCLSGEWKYCIIVEQHTLCILQKSAKLFELFKIF